jgi:hypothetical protein
MSDHPRTIDNGGGEELTFLGIRTDERGEYLEARNTVKPGSGPPMHVHRLQEESLTVERGTMGWQRQAPVQRVVFPVVVAVGRLFGRHERFAAAPEPVTRTRPA